MRPLADDGAGELRHGFADGTAARTGMSATHCETSTALGSEAHLHRGRRSRQMNREFSLERVFGATFRNQLPLSH
jgi:hypothetical protein